MGDPGFFGLSLAVAFFAGYLMGVFPLMNWIRGVLDTILQWIADRSGIIFR